MMQSSLEGAGRKTPDVPSEADEVGQESLVGAAHEIHA
ncbi:hypothetical protein PAMC26577_20605 [Caballeronia sordidicola]|uniref:Uncharacterized protein n=1 Tax=Caballeronia sordidicola TaxID=196367 RepID=A0A242MN08_CABSO|nr:hypothetical protein PAMC26577_20605 [Caballeronia sordidicola]